MALPEATPAIKVKDIKEAEARLREFRLSQKQKDHLAKMLAENRLIARE